MSQKDSGLTVIQRRALEFLDGRDCLVGPGTVGGHLWENPYKRPPQAFARPAGKILNALRAKGLADWITEERSSGWKSWGWKITEAGRVMLKGEA
jgi:hypothetical protein